MPGFRWPAGLPGGSLHATAAAASSAVRTPLQRPPQAIQGLSRGSLTTLASSAGTQPVTCVPASVLRVGQGFGELTRADRLVSTACR